MMGPHMSGGLTMVEQLEERTVAFVHFVDDNGLEVDPEGPQRVDMGTLRPYCTGTWITVDTMLTAEHCVDDIGRPATEPTTALQELLNDLEKHPDASVPNRWTPVNQPVLYSTRSDIDLHRRAYNHGTVIAVDMYNDLALIRAQIPGKHPIAHLSTDTIHDGDDVHIVGMTAGTWWTYIKGYVSAHRPTEHKHDDTEHDMLQVSAPAYFGNSGGAAFNERGDIIGMVDAIERTTPDVTWVVCRDAIRGFLDHVGIR